MSTPEDLIPVGVDTDGASLFPGDTVITVAHENMPPKYVGFRFQINRALQEEDIGPVDRINLLQNGLKVEDLLLATCLDADHGNENDLISPKTVRKVMES